MRLYDESTAGTAAAPTLSTEVLESGEVGGAAMVPRAVAVSAASEPPYPRPSHRGLLATLFGRARAMTGCPGAVRVPATALAGMPAVITGGTGALGTAVAAHMTQQCRCPTTLVSRRGRVSQSHTSIGTQRLSSTSYCIHVPPRGVTKVLVFICNFTSSRLS